MTSQTETRRPVLIGLAAALALGACSDEFDAYNQVQGFRLLAIAADRPALLPGDTSRLSALITVPDGDASFRWSWCPLSAGPAQGFECAVTRDQMQAAADAALGAGAVDVPPLDLGDEPTATFALDGLPPEFFRSICQALWSGAVPDVAQLPQCADSFPLTIRLEVSSAGETIVGIKEIDLLYQDDGAQPNRNPIIDTAFAIHPAHRDVPIALADDGSTTLIREIEYTLRLAISDATAETYTAASPTGGAPETRREDLVVTWFVEGGETDVMRTAFLDGEISLERASENLWTTPAASELAAPTTRLYFVIRDNRGGTSWISRVVGLED